MKRRAYAKVNLGLDVVCRREDGYHELNMIMVPINFYDEIRIDVKDYGIGIKEENLEYIWQRYYRVDKGLKRSTQGTGLGLSIIKEILEYHGFKYGVESTENVGSTFYFEMPIESN